MVKMADRDHADPCRRCGGIFRRAAMTPATRVLRRRATGYYCGPCSTVEARLARLTAEIPAGARPARRH